MTENSPAPPPAGHALLSGKTALVTAAAGTGIGFATAQRLAEEGARVALSDRHERRLGEAAERLAELTGTAAAGDPLRRHRRGRRAAADRRRGRRARPASTCSSTTPASAARRASSR